MKTVSVYGDSLLKGVSLVGNRYTVCTQKMAAFAEAHGIELLNRSYFGATVEKGLWRLNRDIADKTPLGEYTVLEFGGNDCDFDWAGVAADPEGEHGCKVPPERFSLLLQSAVEAVRAAGGRPLLTTLPPIDPKRYLDWICRNGLNKERILLWLGDLNAIYRWQELYATLVRSLSESCQAPLVDLREAFLSRRRMDGLLCADGIHPTDAGYEVILSAFERFLTATEA